MKDIEFKISGMTCEACAKLIARRFQRLQGVNEVAINFSNRLGKVVYDSQIDLGIDSLKEALVGTDYSISNN